ncbi:putative aminomethyl transferase [Amylocarpus encephaloides]|uniref:Iron-sulfur cluster assembly factor IBA57 homolog, mitochondrial n=1 Tax=Amylocarpus encephaloides TaxID=45428 RepID=A0A9P8C1L1_9HELO|nr:putative aminomethyl transferase [Amylocarpus encephaloides]
MKVPRVGHSRPYICHNCRTSHTPASRQNFSFTSTSKLRHPPPSPVAAYTRLNTRRLVAITGPDCVDFLHGVVTQNLHPKEPRTTGFYTAFLNPQGRLLNDVFIYPYKGNGGTGMEGQEGYLIEVDAKQVEIFAKLINRYKLRAKLKARIIEPSEAAIWSVWGADSLEDTPSITACADTRAPGMGARLILPGGKTPDVDLEETGEESYRIRRYLRGVPEGQDELGRESALPQESNVDYMGGIDYRKGCYVGQELTIRTHHTGVVRKRILPIMLYGVDEQMPESLEYEPNKELGVEGRPPAGTGIGRFEKRGRSAGKFVAGVGNIGLGLCRLEVMTDIRLGPESVGYKVDDEFTLEWTVEGDKSEMVKVKAFVPPFFPLNKEI